MQQLLDEASRMPPGSVRFARTTAFVRTPEHLVPRRTEVREKHRGELRQLHTAIEQHFGATGESDDFVNVFYAAGELALMEWVGRRDLAASDWRTLRGLWEVLLRA